MKKIFKEYGGVIIVVIAIVALIGLVSVLMKPGGVMEGAFSNTVQSFVDKSSDLVQSSTSVDYDSIMRSINHRGYNLKGPENTLPAYALSKENGFNYVEADIRFTSDGVPVLLHDVSINRTARLQDGTKLTETINIADITYEEALTYDYGIWKDQEYAGTKIPTLEEFLVFCKINNLYPYLDVQFDGFTKNQAKTLVDLTKKHDIKNVTWISDSVTKLGYIHNYDPNGHFGMVCWRDEDIEANADKLKALKNDNNYVFFDVDYAYTDISSAVSICKESNIPLEIYGSITQAEIQMLDPYITGVTHDYLIAGKILYEDKPILDYEVVKILSSDDIGYGKKTSISSPYYSNDSTRASYVEFDILLEEGYTYKFEFDSTVDTAQMGCQLGPESALSLVNNKNSIQGLIVDSGWQSSSYEYSVKFSNDPIKFVRFAFRIDANNSEITEEFINSVTISRISLTQ